MMPSSARRAAAASARSIVARRNLSSPCAQSVHELNDILGEYRSRKQASTNCVVVSIGSRPLARQVPRRVPLSAPINRRGYSQELPRRFRKDLAQAASLNSREPHVPAISAEGIRRVLQDIGMGHRMSRSEIDGIISELGTLPAGGEGYDCVLST